MHAPAVRWVVAMAALAVAASVPVRAGEPPRHPLSSLAIRMLYPGVTRPPFFPVKADSLPQSHSSDSIPHINTGRVVLLGGLMATAITTIHIYQQNGWWKDNRAPFHFEEDLLYGLNVDKFGHFYGSTLLNFVIAKSLQWADVSERASIWYGAAGALLFQTYVEVEDGFSTWGFDRVDFASDLAGAAWMPLRMYLPALRTVDMKLSYHPSPLLGNPGGTGFRGQKHLMIDDYEGQTIWFSLHVHSVLPEALKSFWPEFLNIAYGYAVRDVAKVHPYRVYFLAPDLDMTKVIPPKTAFLKTLGEALNFLHLPLPAWRFYPTGAFYGVYF